MAADTVEPERWAQFRAIFADVLRDAESTETMIGRLLLELRDHSEDEVEALRNELLAFFEQERLKTGALERELRLLANFRRALVEEMTLEGALVARDLPKRAVASALDNAATSSEISREQAREIVLRWFPADREVLG